MSGKKVFFWVSFIGGLVIFSIGIAMKVAEHSSTRQTYSKFGVGTVQFNGFSGIFLGITALLFSLLALWDDRKSKQQREKEIEKESNTITSGIDWSKPFKYKVEKDGSIRQFKNIRTKRKSK